MPQPSPNDHPPAAPVDDIQPGVPITATLADLVSSGPDAPPPHRLWATLESAYAVPEHAATVAEEERWPPYVALPMAIGLSLVLWVAIVELVLMR